ncbi:MAG: YbaY family lipoprotein [Ruegeria sp.]
MRTVRSLTAIATSIAWLATGAATVAAGTIQGSATYRERIAVPPGAVLEVRLVDISRADAPSITLSSRRYALSTVPVMFELPFDDALIDAGMSYAVQGEILQGERLLFVTDMVYPVLTQGSGDGAELVLVQVAQGEGAGLEGTTWRAFELNGIPLETDKRPEIAFATDGAFGGSSGCNRFSGHAEITADMIAFPEDMAATLMACPPPYDELEHEFFRALPQVSGFQRDGAMLVLVDTAGMAIIRLNLVQ